MSIFRMIVLAEMMEKTSCRVTACTSPVLLARGMLSISSGVFISVAPGFFKVANGNRFSCL